MALRLRKWKTPRGELRSSWAVDYYDQRGKRHVKAFGPGTEGKSAAEDFNAQTRLDLKRGTHIPESDSPTLNKAAEDWLAEVSIGRRGRRPATAITLKNYRSYVDRFILPFFGPQRRIAKIRKADVHDFKNYLLKERELGRLAARNVLSALKGILDEAQERDLIAINPAAKVTVGYQGDSHLQDRLHSMREHVRLILQRLDALASQASPRKARSWRRNRLLIRLAVETGMRIGELRGLPWDAIDFDARTLQVRQQATADGAITERLKSRHAYRTIYLSEPLIGLLKRWKLECGSEALVFATRTGKPLDQAYIYRAIWEPIQLLAGVSEPIRDKLGKVQRDIKGRPVHRPLYRIHDLRHFHASMLLADPNTTPKQVQTTLGHSSVQITFDVYGHLFKDKDAEKEGRERADRLAGRLA